jgi:cellulose synthase/poly-beta-1,6-N-acetylglucosamine synthase-like glycosyltransferase
MYVLFQAISFLIILVIFTYFIYILIHLISWSRLPMSVASDHLNPKTKLSIIIAARNEEEAIHKCIASISAQSYPANLLEIIIVDDHSTDKTKEITEKALTELKIPVKYLSNPEHAHGKKSALSEGIRNSSGELIVITDADCRTGINWLSAIENEYRNTGAFMLCGPVQITGESGLLGHFQSLELTGLSMLSGAGINAGVPLLCNGANMAYTRKVFDDVEGFKGINNNPSGDDILLMFKVNEKYSGKIRYVKSKDAIVSTSAQGSLKSFILQRIRWASKGLYSKNHVNSFVSMLVFSSNFLSIIIILLSIVLGKIFPLLLCSLAIKLLADFLLLLFATDFFGKKKLLWIFPVAEIITMLYIIWVGIAANFLSYSWKDRHYKHPV